MKKLLAVVAVSAAIGVQAGTYYVDANAADGGTGTSWGDAFNSLGAALEVATGEGDEILLAGNNLTPEATFVIANHPGLAIRGGYTGADDVTRTGRTRIVGKSSGTRFRIFDVSASSITFDGVSIEKGYEPVNGSAGQGVQITGESSVVFTNCAFVGNGGYAGADYWTQYGGAISAQDGTLLIADCDFSGNSLRYGNHYYPCGGAIYAKNESVQITGTRFDKNYCDPGWDTVPKGGAIMLEGCSRPFIDNCTFTTNWLEKDAGANTSIGGTLHLARCTDATIRDCRVLGGYIKDSGSSPYLTTGQAFQFTDSTVALTRTVFYKIGSGNGNGVIDVSGATSRLYMTNVLVSAALKGWALGNQGAVIEAVNCTFTGVTNADESRLYAGYMQNGGTASFKNCIFWDLKDGRVNLRAGSAPTFVCCTDVDADPLFADTLYCHPKSQAGRYDGGWFTGGEWVTDEETSSVAIDNLTARETVTAEPQPNGHHVNLGYDGNTAAASKSYVDDRPIDGSLLQVLAYPDYEVVDTEHLAVYGTLAGTGGGGSADVWMVWDSEDRGESSAWAHEVACGSHAQWDLVSAVMENPSGKVYYRFYAKNGMQEIDWSSPVRSLKTPSAPAIAYGSPAVCRLFRTSARVRVNLTDDFELPSTVSVSYWPVEDPTAVVKVNVNGGEPVAVGSVFVDLAGLLPGTEYVYFAEAVNSAGKRTLAQQFLVTVAETTPLTLCAGTGAQGLADGSDWANATTLSDAIAQTGCDGDEIRILEGDYVIQSSLLIANCAGFTLRGGYAGEGEARSGRSRITRDSKADQCHILDISASTVTIDGITVANNAMQTAGVYGQGVRVRDNSNATFTNCLFSANGADTFNGNWTLYGGAIGCNGGRLTIDDCEFTGNRFNRGDNLGGQGAAAYANNANVTVRNSRFDGNYTRSGWEAIPRGGALAFNACPSVQIEGCAFTTNYASRSYYKFVHTGLADGACGGAISLVSCPSAAVRDCHFEGNYVLVLASGGGTGAYAQVGVGHGIASRSSTLSVSRCVFLGEGEAGASGNGAIDIAGGSLFMTNVLMNALGRGWAVGNDNGAVEAVNCTFNNVYKGGATPDADRKYPAYSQNLGTATFTGCIFQDLADGVSFEVHDDPPVLASCIGPEKDALFGDTLYCHPKSQAGRYDGGWFAGGAWTIDDVTSAAVDGLGGFLPALATEPQPNGRHVNIGYDGNTETASKSVLGTNPAVTGDALQIFSYPDRVTPSPTEVTVFGDLAATGVGTGADVYLAYDNEDHGTSLESWPAEKTITCGSHEPWDLVSATIPDVAGTIYYRFFAVNGAGDKAATDPARSFTVADRPVIAYATPLLTCRYHSSARINLELVSNDDLDTTVSVTYWPANDPSDVTTLYANGGEPVAIGTTFVDVRGLEPNVEYVCRAAAESVMGVRELEERTFSAAGEGEALTLRAGPVPTGLADGTSFENAMSVEVAFREATGAGDVIRLQEGTYNLAAGFAITNHPGLVVEGGYTGADDVTRGGRSRLVRTEGKGSFRVLDILASTVTVSGVSIEQGSVTSNGAIGHGVRMTLDSSVVFTNCAFVGNGGNNVFGNQWSEYGGGLGIVGGTLKVEDCDFNDNFFYYGNNFSAVGGAIYAKQADLSVVNSRFLRNYGRDGWNGSTRGGAVVLDTCTNSYFGGCTFSTNYVHRQAGLYAYGGTLYFTACKGARIEGCRFNAGRSTYVSAQTQSNTYDLFGQVCYFLNSSVSMLNSVFDGAGKDGSLGGGAVDVSGGTFGMTNVLFVGTQNCWGVGNKGGAVSAANCTFAGISTNTGDRAFAAYVQNTSGTASFRNCILWDVPCGTAYKTAGDDPTFARCAAEYAVEGSKNLLLTASPFTDAEAGDYTLFNGSPCVGAGNAKGITVPTDLAGNPRVIGRIDLGPYESPYTKGLKVIVK